MTAPLLAVGIGNTTIKFGLTTTRAGSGDLRTAPDTALCEGLPTPHVCPENAWPIWQATREIPAANFDPSALAGLLPQVETAWVVASVQRAAEERLRDWIRVHRPLDKFHLLSHNELPLQINVEAPHRVGMDRLTAAVAANTIRDPHRPAIVIDAGTAITVNLVTADGVFQGGVILPGFSLTAKALAMGTDQLPLIAADLNAEPPSVVGKSTEAAIRSGLFWGNVGAVREIVDRVQRELSVVPQVFVTGGDARRLSGFVSSEARFVPDLVLAGIVASAISTSQK